MNRHAIAALLAMAPAGCSPSSDREALPQLDPKELAGSACDAFVGDFALHLQRSAPEGRTGLIDSLLSSTLTFPWIAFDSTSVCFVHRASARSVAVAGDFNGWAPMSTPMQRHSGTDLWFWATAFDPSARLEYKFVVDGSTWLLDPLNPRQTKGGFGANSELAMPGYESAWETVTDPGRPAGTLHPHAIQSRVLQQQRSYQVYTPAGYDPAGSVRYPLVVFHDGSDYMAFAQPPTVLDNLIATGRIEPVIAVFVPPVNRNDEYAFGLARSYLRFIVDELTPAIDSAYRTETDPGRRAMTGPSLGALISTRICAARPDLFGLCAPISPAYWPEDGAVMRSVIEGPVKPIRWYIDWGAYEILNWDNPDTPHPHSAPRMKDYLLEAGYEVRWNEWPEGHSWGSWRSHLDNVLEYFFQGPALAAPGR